MSQLLCAMPLFWPGALLSTVAAGVCAPRVARRLGIGPVSSYCLVLALGGIAVANLLTDVTPDPGGDRHRGGAGFAGGWRLPGPADLAGLDQRSVNVLLFVPLGVAVVRARPVRRALCLAGAAAAVPFAIEWVQYEVVWLLRAARAQDVVDSLCGLLLGLALGAVRLPVRRRASSPTRASGRFTHPSGSGFIGAPRGPRGVGSVAAAWRVRAAASSAERRAGPDVTGT
jgi:hypothetical protein